MLWIDEEASQTQGAIGFITADEEHGEKQIQLRLPHAAFTDFWNAANSTVTLKIDDAMMKFEITDVILSEGTPIHPLVAELRSMWRDRCGSSCFRRTSCSSAPFSCFSLPH